MSGSGEKSTVDQEEYWEVSHAAGRVTSYACSLSAQFIQDGILRIEFNNEVACYMQQIVKDFEDGARSFKEAIEEILEEHSSLINQTAEDGIHILGLVAGGYQVAGGITLCAGIVSCTAGALSVAHGLNNIYENGTNLLSRTNNTEGPVRKFYQYVAEIPVDGESSNGDVAYGLVDLSLSLFGIFRRIPSKDARRLFRYIDEDMVRAYKETRKVGLGIDIAADVYTGNNVLDILTTEVEVEVEVQK